MAQLCAAGHEVVDFGAHDLSPDDDYPDWLLLDSRGVELATSYNLIFTCRILLEVVIFQGP